ncbi:MAG: flagellar biosynthesis protein FlhB [Candidatus Kryptoniota bacterium]
MAEQSFQERTEPATPKRRQEIRKKGQVAKSVELTSAAVLLFGIVAIYIVSRGFVAQLGKFMRSFLSLSNGYEISDTSISKIAATVMLMFAEIVAPIILVVMIVGIISNLLQSGLMFTLQPILPKSNKLNPLSGLKRVGFSEQSLMQLAKSILKMSLVGIIGYFSLRNLMNDSIQLMDSSPAGILSYMGNGAFTMSVRISGAFVVLAAIDYFFQRRKFERDIRMTKQEVKEEAKQNEGDPAVKARIRKEMYRRSRMRMMQAVPTADVVVTNPTHYAVALKYDSKKMAAPKVVAKGKDLLAIKIKEIAMEHNVPIMEDKPLAQVLYKTVDIDETVPPELFRAVAQILAYVYQMKKIKNKSSVN